MKGCFYNVHKKAIFEAHSRSKHSIIPQRKWLILLQICFSVTFVSKKDNWFMNWRDCTNIILPAFSFLQFLSATERTSGRKLVKIAKALEKGFGTVSALIALGKNRRVRGGTHPSLPTGQFSHVCSTLHQCRIQRLTECVKVPSQIKHHRQLEHHISSTQSFNRGCSDNQTSLDQWFSKV